MSRIFCNWQENDASSRQGLERFFNELAPRLEAARTVERELNRQLARRFNAFDYLRPDEQGLSKMIRDLLDPEGPHGQGQIFLRLFLEKVGFDCGADMRNSRACVELEIEGRRRLDVAVRIDDDRHCLAIENKPFAGDQEDQIKDYLDWLRKNYGDRFLLIYLSPRGEAPSGSSVEPADLRDEAGNATRTFRIMPYHRAEDGAGDDEFAPFRAGFGLADWLRECREHCDVERLRWFLREAETFCEREFGGSAMTTGEHEMIKDFLLADDRNLATACAIQPALRKIDEEISRQFLETIADRLVALGYRSISNYSDKRYGSWVQADLPHWRHYQDAPEPECARTGLRLEAWKVRGNEQYWYIGIRSPVRKSKMSEDGLKRRKRIEERLRRIGESKNIWPDHGSWPWYVCVGEQYKNWDLLIPDLHRELQQNGGEITDYFVNKFVEIAKFAVPILDDVEGNPG